MKYLTFSILLLLGTVVIVSSCKDDDEPCIETTWYQDGDGDGLGNSNVSQDACDQPINYVANDDDDDDVCSGVVDVCGVCAGTGESTWYEDADGDGLGNPDVSQSACEQPNGYVSNSTDTDDLCVGVVDECGVCGGPGELTWYIDEDNDGLGDPNVSIEACDQPDGYVADNTDTNDSGGSSSNGGTPISAFDEFNSDAVTISFDGDDITIVSNGLPNHTSPYWGNTNSLYIDPVVADPNQMSPGSIREGSYTVTLPASPEKASTSSATGLGAIGIAVTGAPIFNDEEGPNIALSENVASGFDYAGAHMGPTGYHYHLEAQDVTENTTLSQDDDKLVGILSDGFLLYGRRCNGDHPTDLDESGGHKSSTQHSNGEEFYHYHIINEIFVGPYYLLFGGDLQGTPNRIM